MTGNGQREQWCPVCSSLMGTCMICLEPVCVGRFPCHGAHLAHLKDPKLEDLTIAQLANLPCPDAPQDDPKSQGARRPQRRTAMGTRSDRPSGKGKIIPRGDDSRDRAQVNDDNSAAFREDVNETPADYTMPAPPAGRNPTRPTITTK